MSETIISTLLAAGIGAAVLLHIYYDRRKPMLEVKVSKKEPYFQARIEVHNRSRTTYIYRIKVDNAYLNWQKNEVEGKSHDNTRIMLTENYGSDVVLDPVLDKLRDHEIEIECYGWRPAPWPKTVFSQFYYRI